MSCDPLSTLRQGLGLLHKIPDDQLRTLLEDVVSEILAGRDPRMALDLTDAGYTRLCEAHRNHHLRTAASLLGEGRSWKRSEKLAQAAARFESITWPRWRDLERPPESASPLQVALFHARRWRKFPRSVMQFHNLTNDSDNKIREGSDFAE